MSDDERFDDTAIAIVGMSGRFPGAANYRELWCNTRDGLEAIRRLEPAELDELDVPVEIREQQGFVPVSAFLDGPDLFDAGFFGVQPREAERMDPQHRVFLECSWHALEDAGYDAARVDGQVALYAGSTLSSYLLFNVAPHHTDRRSSLLEQFQLGVANSADFLATRVAYKLNLTGPAITVLTGCSSSLVAVHLAAQSLLCGESDLALAGGVSIQVNNRGGYMHTPDGIVSPDGHCRPFDAQASGTVFGSGAGVVVLKRLTDALNDGDNIRAVLLGSATNNDGDRKAGFTAPSVSGQAKVIVQALAAADVDPASIGYIEAHGTATSLGDAIEVQALTKAFRTGTDNTGFCALGSVKANIGHLDAAAGVTGLIKTVLSLQHGQIAPVANHVAPAEGLANSPFFINASLVPWPVEGRRRAAVSSFGIGGTNAHVVLEQSPQSPHGPCAAGWQALVLSARSPKALAVATENLRSHLAEHPELDLADVAYTLQVGRHVFDHRRFILCRDTDEAVRALAGEPVVLDAAGEQLAAKAHAWVAGEPVHWAYAGPVRRVALPGYPFERKRFWIDPPKNNAPTVDTPAMPVGQLDVQGKVVRILSTVSGRDPSELATNASFFQLGLDSLALVEAGSAINQEFGVRIPIRQMFEQLPTIEALAAHIVAALPEPEPPQAVHESEPQGSAAEQLMVRQLKMLQRQAEIQQEVMTEQLRVLGGKTTDHPHPPTNKTVPEEAPVANLSFQPAQLVPDPLTPRQRKHVDELIEQYTARTRGSKELTERSRNVRANHRNALNFRPMWKELVYPIFAAGGEGGRITDIDGNEYVDLAMSFGATLLGHSPKFVTEAIKRELTSGQGMLIGPCTPHAELVARLVSELTGAERVAFFNSGTEAVMLALRLARAATGRSRIAIFAGSFHGTYDGTLVKPGALDRDNVTPIAPGLAPALTNDVLVLPYCTQEALDLVRKHGDELAAVLVEPVQSRNPALDPGPFLRDLRVITEQTGTALVFDETITGFRLHPGGAQALFGVRADIATYGKVAGGGMPLGIVAGKAEFLDSVDGGEWSFGDDSVPKRENQRTFLGGTFCEHPLAMVAARALLEHLKAEGTRLHDRLEEKSARLARRLRDVFQTEQAPIELGHWGSIFRLSVPSNLELFYYHLVHRGVYLWEGRTWFLSDAHTDADLDRIVDAARAGVRALREGGFLPPKTGEPERLSMTQDHRQMWFLSQRNPSTYNESARLRITGGVDVDSLRRAVTEVVNRHEALRTGFASDGESRLVHNEVRIEVPVLPRPSDGVDAWWAEQVRTPFQLDKPPLLRVHLIEHDALHHDLIVVAHHLALDGWSWSVVLQELAQLYTGFGELAAPARYEDFLHWQKNELASTTGAAAREHWSRELKNPPAPLVPARKQPGAGGRAQVFLDIELHRALGELARAQDCSTSMVLLACFEVFVHRLTRKQDFLIAIPSAGQAAMGAPNLVGHCTNLLPIRARIEPAANFADLVRQVKSTLSATYNYQSVPLAELTNCGEAFNVPPISVLFNVDRKIGVPKLPGFDVEVESGPVLFARETVSLNAIEIDERLRLDFGFDTELFDGTDWPDAFADLLRAVVGNPVVTLERLGLDVPGAELTAVHEPAVRPAAWVRPALDEVERVVIGLWREEFDAPVDRDSDFFDLGGTSLQATRLLSRVERAFGARVPLADLFRHRTPARFAALVRKAEHHEVVQLQPAPRDAENYPLSFGQQRLWFIDQMGAGRSYVLFTAARLRGPLEPPALRDAIDTVVHRHEVLHTVFRDIDGEPVQVIGEPLAVPFAQIDLTSAADQDAALRDYCLAESNRPFDLGEAPLLRASLLRFAEEDHVFVLAMHHIVSDGWSLDVLLHEVATLYGAAVTGESPLLPELPVQYLDYALWQRSRLKKGQYQRELEYWKRELDGAPLVLELRTDRPRPAVQTFGGASYHVRLPDDVTERLRRFVSAEKVSLFSTSLAAFSMLMGLYSGRDEVLVGTPSANRHRIEVEPLIGFFVNMLVIRASPGACDSFADLARQVQERVLAANANQDLPFDRLVDELLDERDASAPPIFQVMFVLNEMPTAQRVAGVEMSPIRFERTLSRFDLTLLLEDNGKDLLAVFEYNTDLFEASTIEQMATRYVAFLRNALPEAG